MASRSMCTCRRTGPVRQQAGAKTFAAVNRSNGQEGGQASQIGLVGAAIAKHLHRWSDPERKRQSYCCRRHRRGSCDFASLRECEPVTSGGNYGDARYRLAMQRRTGPGAIERSNHVLYAPLDCDFCACAVLDCVATRGKFSSVALSPLRSLHSRSFSMLVDNWLLSLRLWPCAWTLLSERIWKRIV